MSLDNFFLIFFIFLFLFLFFSKFKILSDNISFSNHKKIGIKNKSPVILGGVYLLIIVLLFYPNNLVELKVIFLFITLLGLMSDKNILPNPSVRLIFQITLILCLVYFENLRIFDLRIDTLNYLLSKNIFNILFTTFCLAILINGSNFIDGLNGLLIGYYLLILSSIFYISFNNDYIFLLESNFLVSLFFSMVVIFIFNIFGKVYLGDSGSYLISVVLGAYLIKFYYLNTNISPYYIALILWYPAFENLFSLIRRISKKKNISSPDNRHLHQLVFLFFKSKNVIDMNILNSFSSLLIIIFCVPGFIFANLFPLQSSYLLIVLTLNVVFYLFIYLFLAKNLKIKK